MLDKASRTKAKVSNPKEEKRGEERKEGEEKEKKGLEITHHTQTGLGGFQGKNSPTRIQMTLTRMQMSGNWKGII